MKKPTIAEHKWARLYRRVRSDQMSQPDRLAEYDPVQNIVFINAPRMTTRLSTRRRRCYVTALSSDVVGVAVV
jgi:hypothetical protein